MAHLTESDMESAAFARLEAIGRSVAHGPDIAPDQLLAERRDYGEVVLAQRLRDALARLSPDLPPEALEDAFRRLTHPEGATLEARNQAFHHMLMDEVTVEYWRPDGRIAGAQGRVLDFEDPDSNDRLAAGASFKPAPIRRPSLVLFVNGLPVAIIGLKNPADEEATIWTAFNQLSVQLVLVEGSA